MGLALHALRSDREVVPDRGDHRAGEREHSQRPEERTRHPDAHRDLWILGQAVPFRVIAVREHRHHRRAAHAGGIVERGLRETGGLELVHALLPQRHHVRLVSEVQTSGGTRLHARRLQTHLHAIHAQRALGHLGVAFVEARHVERAPGGAHPAADALVRVHVHDAVLVLDDGARGGAGAETTGSWRSPVPDSPDEAEERRISSSCTAMALLLSYATLTFSSFTRNALNSGVQVLGSITDGVSRLARGPVWPSAPAKPQWMGKPICQTSFPSIFIGNSRLVTTAGPS